MPKNDPDTYRTAQSTLDAMIRSQEFRRLRQLCGTAPSKKELSLTIASAVTSALTSEDGAYSAFIFDRKLVTGD